MRKTKRNIYSNKIKNNHPNYSKGKEDFRTQNLMKMSINYLLGVPVSACIINNNIHILCTLIKIIVL